MGKDVAGEAERGEERRDQEGRERPQLPEEPIWGVLTRGKIVVKGEEARLLYEAGYYGMLEGEGRLVLEPEEALLLMRRGRLRVRDRKGVEMDFRDLLHKLSRRRPGLWTRYLVYSDLRGRGYVVRTGYGGGLLFRVYPRGARLNEVSARYFVCSVSEGAPLKFVDLEAFSQQALRNRKKLMLAVLDRQGEPTYYIVSPADIAVEKVGGEEGS